MRLVAYPTSDDPVVVQPASPRREWMDGTTNRYAYRCLPLTIGNQYGWEMLCPCSFEALWTGGHSIDSIQIIRLGSGKGRLPESHFGEGVLTFHPRCLFRTEDPYNLYVTGPTNIRKDGIAPLTGIVETSWLPFTFTMNWIFTRVGVPIRFEEGEPFCQFFPVPRHLVESVQPEWRALESDPELKGHYEQWSASRDAFNEELKVPGSAASIQGWQRFYARGMLHTGEAVATEHQTRLKVPPFRGSTNPSSGEDACGRQREGRDSQARQVVAAESSEPTSVAES